MMSWMDLGVAFVFKQTQMGSDPRNPFNQCKNVNQKKSGPMDGQLPIWLRRKSLKKHVTLPLSIDVDKNLVKTCGWSDPTSWLIKSMFYGLPCAVIITNKM